MRIDKFVFLFIFFGLAFNVHAQNLGLSSYSRLGIGDIAEQGLSRNNAMGGAGVASYHQFQINALNPASMAVLKSTNFEFDLAGKLTSYIARQGSQTGLSSNIQHISLALPVHRRFVVQLGARPFSSVSYADGDNQSALENNNPSGTKSFSYDNSGYGGLSDLFLGAAYNYKDWLLLGLNAGIVMGQSVYESKLEERQVYRNRNITERFEQHLRVSPGLLITRQIKRNRADLVLTDSLIGKKDSTGYQKKIEVVPVSDNWYYGLGITASFFNTLQAQESQRLEQSVYAINYTADGFYYDYFLYQRDTLKSGNISNYSLPSSFRVGVSLYKPNKLSFVLDYNFTSWGNYSHNQFYSKSVDQHGIALGTEFIPEYNSTKYYKRIAYRAGLNVKTLPYEIKGQSITQMQLSAGAGFVFPRTGVTLNLSLAYGQRGTTNENLVKENYWLATIGVISNNRWFIRRRHD